MSIIDGINEYIEDRIEKIRIEDMKWVILLLQNQNLKKGDIINHVNSRINELAKGEHKPF
jgi:hypothetical protein